MIMLLTTHQILVGVESKLAITTIDRIIQAEDEVINKMGAEALTKHVGGSTRKKAVSFVPEQDTVSIGQVPNYRI